MRTFDVRTFDMRTFTTGPPPFPGHLKHRESDKSSKRMLAHYQRNNIGAITAKKDEKECADRDSNPGLMLARMEGINLNRVSGS